MSSSPLFRGRHYSWLSSFLRDETRRIKQNHYLKGGYTGAKFPENEIYKQLVLNLTQALSQENPNFDPRKFLLNSDLSPLVESIDREQERKEIQETSWWHEEGSRKTLSNLSE